MRAIFGKTITELAQKDPLVQLIVGDIGFKIFDDVPRAQFHNVGTIEQTMVGLAAGMALAGLKPWVYTITPFLLERAFEQVKLDVDANNADVKLVGYADYPGQGISHANVLDFITHNPFPHTNVYLPENSRQTLDALLVEYTRKGPAIISLKKDRTCQ